MTINNQRLLELMEAACQLAFSCPRSQTAFSVGAVLTNTVSNIISTGYSRELGETYHAEEAAIEKAAGALTGELVIFSSLEPCSVRLSGRRPCCSILIESGIKTIVIGAREPSTFVEGKGYEMLTAQGINVIELREFEDSFREANKHLLLRKPEFEVT